MMVLLLSPTTCKSYSLRRAQDIGKKIQSFFCLSYDIPCRKNPKKIKAADVWKIMLIKK